MGQVSICPCCGQSVNGERPIADLNSNTIAFRGHSEVVVAQVAELLNVIVEKSPGMVRYSDLFARLWGLTEPADVRKSLSVTLCKARKLGRTMGFAIETVHGCGLRLVLLQPERLAA